jgi:hypothetical protein
MLIRFIDPALLRHRPPIRRNEHASRMNVATIVAAALTAAFAFHQAFDVPAVREGRGVLGKLLSLAG